MEHQEPLQSFAEVSVAFAGFSAIVSVFDRQTEKDDPRLRHFRVRVMVEYSLCVVIFSFVPYLMNATLRSEELAWRLSSAALALVWSLVGLSSGRRARQILGRSALVVAPAFSAIATTLGYVGATILVLNALGFALASNGAAYILGLFCPLLQSALYFVRIVAHGDPLSDTTS